MPPYKKKKTKYPVKKKLKNIVPYTTFSDENNPMI